MATGYTAGILKGMTFEQFVWGAARGMGAFIMQRDDAHDAPPEMVEKISDYEPKRVDDAVSELARLEALSDAQWRIEYAATRTESAAFSNKINTSCEKELQLYQSMLDRVIAWQPPSPEHEGFKQFMVDQIRSSIDWDCRPYQPSEPPPFGEWKVKRLNSAKHELERARKSLAEEVERVAGRNRWKAQLLASVPLPTTSKVGG